MNQSKYTPWFSIRSSAPAREGVYQLRTVGRGAIHHSRYFGGFWRTTTRLIADASIQTDCSGGVRSRFYTEWRGLAEKPA